MTLTLTSIADAGSHSDDIGYTRWRERRETCGGDAEKIVRLEMATAINLIDRWRLQWREAGLLSDWPVSRDSTEMLSELSEFRTAILSGMANLANAMHDAATTMCEETHAARHDAMRHDNDDAL